MNGATASSVRASGPDVGRVYGLDWVRAGAMVAVFLFHCARPFDRGGWHIKNPETSLGFSVFTTLLAQWMMPTFFLISGWVTFLILQRATPGSFVTSRVKRLLVPFVFGTLVLVPHQVYIERLTQGGVDVDFITWLPKYFDGFYAFGGNFAWMGLHLWYLEMLFLYSLLLLPLFLRLRRPPPDNDRVAPAAILLGAALSLLVTELFVGLFPDSLGREDFGGWSFLTYIVWFLLGYLIGRDFRLQEALVRARHVTLSVALIGVTAGFAIVIGDTDFGYVGNRVVRIAVAWGGVAAILGYAALHLNRDVFWRRSVNEGILPFYILHQSVIVLVAYFVVRWQMAPLVKFAIIVPVSLTIILALYCLIVRPLDPLRFLFGLPSRPDMGRRNGAAAT
jgi:glucan biosynthesis protein C